MIEKRKMEDTSPTAQQEDICRRPSKKMRGKAAPRPFDFRQYKKRRVALEVSYLGGAYQGFARQDSITPETVEGRFFAALKHVKLIPEDMPSSEIAAKLRYSRCGRTDRGVSALGQVLALSLRSCARREGSGPRKQKAEEEEDRGEAASEGREKGAGGSPLLRKPEKEDEAPSVGGFDRAAEVFGGKASGRKSKDPDIVSKDGEVQESTIAAAAAADCGDGEKAAITNLDYERGQGCSAPVNGGLGSGATTSEEASDDDAEEELPDPELEYDYPQIINKALPEDIRVLGWTPVPKDFNARFSATFREYKYYIVAKDLATPGGGGAAAQYDLDIEGMREAGGYLVGEHDFRNFCKHDVSGGVRSFIRRILSFSMDPVGTCAREFPPEVAAAIAAAETEARRKEKEDEREDVIDVNVVNVVDDGQTSDTEELRHRHPSSDSRPAASDSPADIAGSHSGGDPGPGSNAKVCCNPRSAGAASVSCSSVSHAKLSSSSSSHLNPEPAPVGGGPVVRGHQVFACTIRGTAFLWHQIRCVMAVLLMVGRRQEAPGVVRAMLDVKATPRKPQYAMAPEAPLILYGAGYPGLRFRRSAASVASNLACLQGILSKHLVAAAMTSAMADKLQANYYSAPAAQQAPKPEAGGGGKAVYPNGKAGRGASPRHVPLLQRPTEPSVEERIERFGLPPLLPWLLPSAEEDGAEGAVPPSSTTGTGTGTGTETGTSQ